MLRFITLALVWAILATSAYAHKAQTGSPVDLMLPANTQITPWGTATTPTAVFIGDADKFGIDWDFNPASGNPSVNVIILQANHKDGPFTQWTPIDGSTTTTDVTITSKRGGSSLKLSPSGWIKHQFNDTSGITVNVTPRGFHQ